jgi:hypothetical protein
MTIAAAAPHQEDIARAESTNDMLVPQPDGLRLPICVPVLADCGGVTVRGKVLGSTEGVLLVQCDGGVPLPTLGTPIRLRSEWDRHTLNGRIAAHGVAGRFLVSVGERAIRRSKRFAVNLPGVARSALLAGLVEVRVTDLSAGGARVEGIHLPVGSEVGLRFTPPNHSEPLSVSGFVVRVIDGAEVPTVGVAFRLVQPSMDVLGRTALASA